MPTSTDKRILSISVSSRGFGFVVMEGPETLVDWGVKQPRPFQEKRCVVHLEELICRYRPAKFVLENHTARTRACSQRVQDLHETFRAAGERQGVGQRCFSRQQIQRAFAPAGRINKHWISRIVAKILPELSSRLPPFRKPWMSEDYRMAIFDAAALGLTYYQSLARYRGFIHDRA